MRIGGTSLTIGDVSLALLLVVLMLTRKIPKDVNKGYAKLVMFLITVLFLTALINGAWFNSFETIIQYIYVLMLLPFCLVYFSHKELAWVCDVVIVFYLCLVLVAFVLFNLGILDFLGVSFSLIGSTRFGFVFENPNAFSKVNSLMIPILFYRAITRGFGLHVIGLITILIFLIFYMTASIGGLLSSILLVSVLIFFNLENVKIKFFFLGSLIFLFISYFSFIGMFEEYIPERARAFMYEFNLEESGSFSDKVSLMNDALEMISEHPFFGVGLSNFESVSSSGQKVHNIYLLLFAEAGFLAFFLTIALLLYPIYKALRFVDIRRKRLLMTISLNVMFLFFTNAHVYGRYWFVGYFLLLILLFKEERAFKKSLN